MGAWDWWTQQPWRRSTPSHCKSQNHWLLLLSSRTVAWVTLGSYSNQSSKPSEQIDAEDRKKLQLEWRPDCPNTYKDLPSCDPRSCVSAVADLPHASQNDLNWGLRILRWQRDRLEDANCFYNIIKHANIVWSCKLNILWRWYFVIIILIYNTYKN